MNNSVLTLSNPSNFLLSEPKFEMASPTGNVGLSLDQNQLLQITQLMNELAQNQSSDQYTDNQSIELVLHDSHSTSQGQSTISPNSFVQFNQQTGQTSSIQQLLMPQLDQQQVHTIMLNGQPALFIPASAAVNSSLLSQMLQTNQIDMSQELTSFVSQSHEPLKAESEQEQDQTVLIQQQQNGAAENKDKGNKKAAKPASIKSGKKLSNIQPAAQSDQYQTLQIIQNSDQQWIIINNEQSGQYQEFSQTDDGFKKLKRKACDCPNCVEFKKNGCKEEANKRRTHKCHKCAKEYNKTSHLRAHLRGHDNYRPYVCDFNNCTKSFTRSDELKRHKRIHNDDRNFVCNVCKKRFLRSDHLGKHLLVHSKSGTKATPGTVGGHLAVLDSSQISIASLQQQVLCEQNQEFVN
ncbi:transcription factor Sp3 isoform X1 [Brachionus plicatilis]|uniref:Transcription factor Sp3 isoform X1 n=1 Tax=Brachionus plicatilis TaxID=10195 RepID=A0A3M7RN73_BRAPC|nr:transcription factor Sp3 isoform X1 [Brachionus plicatilis]